MKKVARGRICSSDSRGYKHNILARNLLGN
jgi:hypothetical protein